MTTSTDILFGSVCSGIEAASVAWHPLGWRAAWLAEIEPFPSAVLAHHYPEVPNLGDMTKLADRIRASDIPAPDVFCGGTPCQAFSVAGLRRSLDDARGNLSLTFCEIANAIDTVRAGRGDPEAIVFWENVPGVLSTPDNAFGCFLAGLAGEDDPLEPPGGKWKNAGAVFGPQRTVAWRVLDAQYFGVAQRRRRVFVVASARKWFNPLAVLFEFDGVRRDSAPSRGAREGTAGRAASGAGGSRHNSHWNGAAHPPLSQASQTRAGGIGASNQEIFEQVGAGLVAGTLRSTDGGSDVDHARALHLIASGNAEGSEGLPFLTCSNIGKTVNNQTPLMAFAETAHTLRGEGFDASEDGTGRSTPLVPVMGFDTYNQTITGDTAQTLCSRGDSPGGNGHLVPAVLAFDTTQITSAANYSNPKAGDPCHPLAAGVHAPAIAFHGSQDPDVSGDVTHPVGRNQGRETCVAFQDRFRGDDGLTRQTPAVATRSVAQTITSNYGKQVDNSDTALGPNVAIQAMQVRRLTPRECERLQGFPDDYTLIPTTMVTHRKGCEFFGTKEVVAHGTDRLACGCKAKHKPADQCPDGPRYKALGNSWAVPNVHWIGRRIAAQLAPSDAESVFSGPETLVAAGF